jgi:peptidoglycan/xylan/chitin deacetylase (PgdA/CDA1 family)
VLFHNNGLHTAEALPVIIDTLKDQGYEFVKIGDLIYRENYRMAVDGTQISNG